MEQVVIPDLDDDGDIVRGASWSNPPANAESSAVYAPPRPFRGAELAYHGRYPSLAGSGTSEEAPDGGGGGGGGGSSLYNFAMPASPSFKPSSTQANSSSSSFRFPSAALVSPSQTQPPAAQSQSSFSFPRKASLASLRAAIKGQPPIKPPSLPSEPSIAGDSRRPFMGHNQSAAWSTGSGSGAPLPPRILHTQQSSYVSDFSAGAGSSSADSFNNNQPSGIDRPPLPSFPGGSQSYNKPAQQGRGQTSASDSPTYYRDHYYGEEGPVSLMSPDSLSGKAWSGEALSQRAASHRWVPAQGQSPSVQQAYWGGNPTAAQSFTTRPWLKEHPSAEHSFTAVPVTGDLGWPQEGAATPTVHPRQYLASAVGGSAISTSDGFDFLPAGIGSDDPRTPADYVLNILMSRFISITGAKLQTMLLGGGDAKTLLKIIRPKADPQLDTLLVSLSHVARNNTKLVIDSLFEWQETIRAQPIDSEIVRRAMNASSGQIPLSPSLHVVRDVSQALEHRQKFTSLFFLARALIAIAPNVKKGAITKSEANDFEERVFGMLQESAGSLSLGTGIQTVCFQATAELLGELSKLSFASVGDRFVSAMEALLKEKDKEKETNRGRGRDDIDAMMESLVYAMRHLNITVFPLEDFEEGAELMEVFSRFFAAAHGHRVKSVYAETLTQLLLRVAKPASAEINHPTWVKALDVIWPRALAMASKPRYWNVAYPLCAAVLCVTPEDKFLASWYACVEAGVAKLKDRGSRTTVMNAAIRLLWVYLFRCTESSNQTSKRLDAFLRLWFPSGRHIVVPADMIVDPHVYIVHLVLYRHFDIGRDLVADFLRHKELSGNSLVLQADVLSPQRMAIAIRAITITLDHHVRAASPTLPTSADFALFDLELVQDGSGDELLEEFSYPTIEIGEAQAKFNDLIGKIALISEHQVRNVSVFDERIVVTRAPAPGVAFYGDRSVLAAEGSMWVPHPSGRLMVAYQRDCQPYFDLLRACFESWPRCLSANLSFPDILAMLYRAHFSADPALADAASEVLTRIAKQRRGGATAVVTGFMRWIFSPETVFWEVHPNQILLLPKIEMAVQLWIDFLNIWLHKLHESQAPSGATNMERTSAWALIDDVEAYGLLLLCSAWLPLRRQALTILRLVAVLDDAFIAPARRHALLTARLAGDEEEPSRITHLLDRPCSEYCAASDATMTPAEQARVTRWHRPGRKEPLSLLVESDHGLEQSLWSHIVPCFLRICLERFPTTVAVFRSHITNRVPIMDHAIALIAGTIPKMPTGSSTPSTPITPSKVPLGDTLTPDQTLMAEHWRFYILALCTTTTSTEGSRGLISGHHQRQSSSESQPNERVIAARDLFQKLVPFIASDQDYFRDVAVSALGNINANLYGALLETMQSVSAQLNDDWRHRSVLRDGQKKRRRHERLRTAIARVMHLTSPLMESSALLTEETRALLLTWVQDTFNFLDDREFRDDTDFDQLRYLFCGVVKSFYKCLSKSGLAEMHFSFDARLRMFRVFRKWHDHGQYGEQGPMRLAKALAAASDTYRDDKQREAAANRLRQGIHLLSESSAQAMCALCMGSITQQDSSVDFEHIQSFDIGGIFSWLGQLLSSTSANMHSVAQEAFGSLLTHNPENSELLEAAILQSYQESKSGRDAHFLFVVLADFLHESRGDFHVPLALHKLLCLGLIQLGHSSPIVRRKAASLLSDVSAKHGFSLRKWVLRFGSGLPATYLCAQQEVSQYLSDSFTELHVALIAEITLRLPMIDAPMQSSLLSILAHWTLSYRLIADVPEDTLLSREVGGFAGPVGRCGPSVFALLSNLLFITLRYGRSYSTETQRIWCNLVDGADVKTASQILIKFLVDISLKYRSPDLVLHVKHVFACVSATRLATRLLDDLCAAIDPTSMIQVPHNHDGSSADPALRDLLIPDFESALQDASSARRQYFAPGQLYLIFAGELSYQHPEQIADHAPVLMHAAVMQIDSPSTFIQEQGLLVWEHLIRSLMVNARSHNPSPDESWVEMQECEIEALFSVSDRQWWTHEDVGQELDESRTPRAMHSALQTVNKILGLQYPDLKERWGAVALLWATSGPVRHVACRSFQTFRVLLPVTTPSMLANMLGRLSNTISDPSFEIQTFAREIQLTLIAVIDTMDTSQREMLSQIFWATVACLSTVNEAEFAEAINTLERMLSKLDVGSQAVIESLHSRCPEGWEGDLGCLQHLTLRGLRSAATSTSSFSVLCRLAKIADSTLIDSGRGRLGFLFVATLPWFLQATDQPEQERDPAVLELAQDIAVLAELDGKADLQRVATSIARSRFRTKDDLIRQAVACMRAHYLPIHGPDFAVLLLGLTLNQNEWLRRQTMQVLKMFFQAVNMRGPEFANLGSELLMPLLRLLSTPLSEAALEVLDEPIVVNGGPAANETLRMSLHWGNAGVQHEHASDASIFGPPDDSGWAVANPQDLTARTRINLQAVFKTCELTLDVAPISSNVNFVVDDDYDDVNQDVQESANGIDADASSLGDIVNQLHDLSSFFVEEKRESIAPRRSFGRFAYGARLGSESETPATSTVAKIVANASSAAQRLQSRSTTSSSVAGPGTASGIIPVDPEDKADAQLNDSPYQMPLTDAGLPDLSALLTARAGMSYSNENAFSLDQTEEEGSRDGDDLPGPMPETRRGNKMDSHGRRSWTSGRSLSFGFRRNNHGSAASGSLSGVGDSSSFSNGAEDAEKYRA